MKNSIKQLLIAFTIVCVFSFNSYANSCGNTALFALEDSTVEIHMKMKSGGYGKCTGIIINDGVDSTGILTAQHCVENTDMIVVDRKYIVTSVYESKNIDVAYIIISNIIMRKTAIKISKSNIAIGETAYSLGWPKEYSMYNCGKVIASNKKTFVSNFSVIKGCSGSGVINARNELVGILWGGRTRNDGVGYVLSLTTNIREIRKFLKSIDYLKETSILVK